jgi:hypothetical protein
MIRPGCFCRMALIGSGSSPVGDAVTRAPDPSGRDELTISRWRPR